MCRRTAAIGTVVLLDRGFGSGHGQFEARTEGATRTRGHYFQGPLRRNRRMLVVLPTRMSKASARNPRAFERAGGANGSPIVAIVGRPNVGKSTLFNRLARARLAIVDDSPGVTRDRLYAETSAHGKRYAVVDTGGFDPQDEDPMKAGIATHVRAAIAEADVILFVGDATTGPNDADRAAVALLRKSRKPVIYAANKADSQRVDAEAFEFYRLGLDRVHPVSALHGRGIGELETALVSALPAVADALAQRESAGNDDEEQLDDEPPDPVAALERRRNEDAAPERRRNETEETPQVALVGRPNAGKSSLLNRVLGEDRVLVDPRPGTTRDAVDAFVTRNGKRYVFIDTAGIRRKAKVAKEGSSVESLSVLSSIRAVERAHVVVALCDAEEGVAEQDAKILGLAEERGRAMVVALSKMDLLSKSELGKAEEDARDKLTFLPYVPIVRTSASTGRGVSDLFATIDRVHAAWLLRVPTGALNRFFEQVLDRHPPPTMGGRAPRLYYVTQAEVAPPTFVVMTNAPEAIHFSYRRYVVNQLRQHFGFEGTPVRVLYRARRREKRS
jgi:GTP-binding protein